MSLESGGGGIAAAVQYSQLHLKLHPFKEYPMHQRHQYRKQNLEAEVNFKASQKLVNFLPFSRFEEYFSFLLLLLRCRIPTVCGLNDCNFVIDFCGIWTPVDAVSL